MAAFFRIIWISWCFWALAIAILTQDFLAGFLLPVSFLAVIRETRDILDFMIIPLAGGLIFLVTYILLLIRWRRILSLGVAIFLGNLTFLTGLLLSAELYRAALMGAEAKRDDVQCSVNQSFITSLIHHSKALKLVPHGAILTQDGQVLIWSYRTRTYQPAPEQVVRNLDLRPCDMRINR